MYVCICITMEMVEAGIIKGVVEMEKGKMLFEGFGI